MLTPDKNRVSSVSLVIPCNHSEKDLWVLLYEVLHGTYLPDEILVVRSGVIEADQAEPQFRPLTFCEDTQSLVESSGVSLKVFDLVSALPGEARNIGVQHSAGNLIAFLDVKTILVFK